MIKSRRYKETGPFREMWAAINRLVDDVQSLRLTPGINTRIHPSPWGSYVTGNPASSTEPSESNVSILFFRIREIHNEYLVCDSHNGIVSTADLVNPEMFIVSKPRLLIPRLWKNESDRSYSEDGHSLRNVSARVASSEVLTGVESLIPSYAVNDLILCAKNEGEFSLAIYDDDGEFLQNAEWIDLNTDGRRFELLYKGVSVCKTDGTLARMLFQAGNTPT